MSPEAKMLQNQEKQTPMDLAEAAGREEMIALFAGNPRGFQPLTMKDVTKDEVITTWTGTQIQQISEMNQIVRTELAEASPNLERIGNELRKICKFFF